MAGGCPPLPPPDCVRAAAQPLAHRPRWWPPSACARPHTRSHQRLPARRQHRPARRSSSVAVGAVAGVATLRRVGAPVRKAAHSAAFQAFAPAPAVRAHRRAGRPLRRARRRVWRWPTRVRCRSGYWPARAHQRAGRLLPRALEPAVPQPDRAHRSVGQWRVRGGFVPDCWFAGRSNARSAAQAPSPKVHQRETNCYLYWHDSAAFRSAVASSSSFPAPPQPNWRGHPLSSPTCTRVCTRVVFILARITRKPCARNGQLLRNTPETHPKHPCDLSHESLSTIRSGFRCTMSPNDACAPEADGEFDAAGAMIVRLQSRQSQP